MLTYYPFLALTLGIIAFSVAVPYYGKGKGRRSLQGLNGWRYFVAIVLLQIIGMMVLLIGKFAQPLGLLVPDWLADTLIILVGIGFVILTSVLQAKIMARRMMSLSLPNAYSFFGLTTLPVFFFAFLRMTPSDVGQHQHSALIGWTCTALTLLWLPMDTLTIIGAMSFMIPEGSPLYPLLQFSHSLTGG